MDFTLPGNSFPQICVVSVNNYELCTLFSQGHGRTQHLSNKKQSTIPKTSPRFVRTSIQQAEFVRAFQTRQEAQEHPECVKGGTLPTNRMNQVCPKRKKRSSQATCLNMLPGNSFPQICVVSVNKSVKNVPFRQEYLRTEALSNTNVYCSVNSNPFVARCCPLGWVCGTSGRCRAHMESSMRLSAPVLRISLPTWAFTVRSSMPSSIAISRFERASRM